MPTQTVQIPAPRRVVIVEDHDGVRQLVRTLLDLEDGLDVVGEASTGKAALATVKRLRPDAVVLDLGLPEIDGEDVLARVHRDQPNVRVVVLSGEASALSWQRLEQLGAAALVEKGVGAWDQLLITALAPAG